MRSLFTVAVALGTLLSTAGGADARSERRVAFAPEEMWSTVIRFLKVDERAEIRDKDTDAGYVLFDRTESDGEIVQGALEIIGKDDQVRVVISLKDRPSYEEALLLTRLERKLRAELGSPAPRPPADAP
ncbi:MAG: hypothetical protein R2939_11945 [Kofleriaceae bacterium]